MSRWDWGLSPDFPESPDGSVLPEYQGRDEKRFEAQYSSVRLFDDDGNQMEFGLTFGEMLAYSPIGPWYGEKALMLAADRGKRRRHNNCLRGKEFRYP